MLFSAKISDFLANTFYGAFQSFIRVHFQNQMHAALKIEAQVDLFMRPQGWFYGGKNVYNGNNND